MEYASGEAAARALGVNGGSVRSCCSGERKRAGEYEFKWAPLAADQHDRPGEEWREVQLADAESGASLERVQSASEKGRVRVPELSYVIGGMLW